MFSQDRWPMTLLHALTKQPTDSSNAIKQQTFAPDISNAVNQHTFETHTNQHNCLTTENRTERHAHYSRIICLWATTEQLFTPNHLDASKHGTVCNTATCSHKTDGQGHCSMLSRSNQPTVVMQSNSRLFACELPQNSFSHRITWMRANTEQYAILRHVLTRQIANDIAPYAHETFNRQ